MKINLDKASLGWQKKTRLFVESELLPSEIEAEMNQGKLPAEISYRHKKMAIELGFSRMDAPVVYGGLALRNIEQAVVWEQLGRVTNALCWCFSEPHQWMFDACNEDQLKRFVLPLMDGTRKECYAITEQESGSDVVIQTTATPVNGGYRVNGEKWFVTSANLADYLLTVVCKYSAGAVICVRIVQNGLCVNCVSTESGRAPAKFSAWSLQTHLKKRGSGRDVSP